MSNQLEDNCDIDIDIVGEYHCISITNSRGEQELSNGLITVDYTVNPSLWLSENSLEWNNTSNREESELELENCDELNDNQNLIYEKDIPASVEEEVVAYGDEDSYEISQDDSIDSYSENLVDSNTNSNISLPQSRSLLKINQPPCKFKQTLLINRSLLKSNQRQLKATSELITQIPKIERCDSDISISSHSSITSTLSPSILVSSSPSPERVENHVVEAPQQTTKFRQTVKFQGENLMFHKKTISMIKNRIKAMNNNKQSKPEKEKKRKRKKHKRHHRKHSNSSNTMEQSNINILEPRSSANIIKIDSGEIVKVAKIDDDDSDVEIDVMDGSDVQSDFTPQENIQVSIPEPSQTNVCSDSERILDLRNTNPHLFDFINSCEIPSEEVILEQKEISDLERFMCFEFFNGKPTKTPERYLRIRNHILSIWTTIKPMYLSKTQARQGLRNCGDVNSISRIHSFLEQIGAINFGCHENFQYIRPLKAVYEMLQIPPKPRILPLVVPPSNISNFINERKQRIRNYNNSFNGYNSEDVLLNDANYTIQHMENIPRPEYTQYAPQNDKDSMINRIKSRTKHKKDFELVRCQRFSRENIAPFKVSISLSTLLCLYLHALSSKLEIMGFLGGHVSKCVGRDKLSLTRYKPTRTSSQSGINCEMCPISQVEQSSILTNEGYELLGWFHSHPLFPPNPSRTDLRTQTEMQMQFASNNPFIGFILSCVDLEFKCIYMCADSPYELEVEIVKDYVDIKTEIKDIFNIIDKYGSEYQETLEKFISSGNALFKQLSINDCIENLVKDFI